MMLVVANGELGDESRIESRIGFKASRLPVMIIQAASAPAPSLPKASKHWSTITARVGLAGAGALDRFGNAGRDRIRDRPGKLALKTGGRTEMMEQIGVGAADLRRDGFQRDGLRALRRAAAHARRRARLSGFLPGVRRVRLIDISVS